MGKHPLRGTEGEIHVNHLSSPNAGVDAFIKGCTSTGIPSNPDYNAESMIGAGPIQTSTHHGWRWNGASAFIAPIMNRSNLTLLPWTHTTRLIFEGNRVTGVAIVRGKHEAELRACREQIIGCNKEVIVCAGAIGSPHLLLLSGIGPREELQQQGIPCVADLPVGRNLQDHLCLPVPFESKIPSLSEAHIGLWDIWSYLRSGTGVLSSVFVEGTAFLRTGVRSDLPQPDLQYHFAPATLSAENWDNFNVKPEIRDKMLKAVPGFTQILAPTLIRPASVGTITLASPDPLIHPLIDPHYLEDKRDVDVLIAGCKIACRIAKTDAMQKVVGKLLLHVMDYGNPYNFETQEDQYWEYWVRFASATLYHPAGTCKMGAANDPTAVVTPDLRVKGIQGLRVADASIMPEVISGNTNAPSMMIGSKCAELIRLSTSVPIPPPSSATAPKRPVQVIQQSKL